MKTKQPKKPAAVEKHFAEISGMILHARKAALRTVDALLVDLYWKIGGYISKKVALSEWGEGTVESLAKYLESAVPDVRGFNRRGLYRMKQFYEAYIGNEKVSAVRTQISWTCHRLILSKANAPEEREFYILLCSRETYTSRELERQINSNLFERTITKPPKLSTPLRQIQPAAETLLRDSYTLDFLGLSPNHSEYDLLNGIVRSLKNFIIEFGRDFAFVGELYEKKRLNRGFSG